MLATETLCCQVIRPSVRPTVCDHAIFHKPPLGEISPNLQLISSHLIFYSLKTVVKRYCIQSS